MTLIALLAAIFVPTSLVAPASASSFTGLLASTLDGGLRLPDGRLLALPLLPSRSVEAALPRPSVAASWGRLESPSPSRARLGYLPVAYVQNRPLRAASTRQLVFTVRATAYTSLRNQTNSTPFVTATGSRTRFGVVALSRDLLARIPYGSKLKLEDLGLYGSGRGAGANNRYLQNILFVVEDAMHPRKFNQIDIWFPAYSQAMNWGVRQLRVTLVQYGRG